MARLLVLAYDSCVFVIRSKVLNGARFMHLFEDVEVSNFEVASDAFSTFKVSET